MTDKNNLVRLNKFIAQNGIASRRGADDLVFNGKVTINGTLADSPGIKVNPSCDIVEVNGKTIGQSNSNKNVVILLHKPIETVTTAKDPQGRTTVLDLLPKKIQELRPFPVGRLDYYSEGLLLITTDGDLCYRLTHPKWHLPKVYNVTVRGTVSEKALNAMRTGMTLNEGEKLAPAKVKLQKPIAGTQVIEITLIQGINRQIRRMCDQLGLTILRLKRVKQGPISLGNLKRNKWRELTQEEIQALKKAVKLA